MPLKKGYSKKSQAANFHELKKARPDMSPAQRTAVVLGVAREAAKKAGKPGKGPGPAPKRKAKKK